MLADIEHAIDVEHHQEPVFQTMNAGRYAREPRLEVARSRYIESVAKYPSRLVMLCDRATVLARSDRIPAMRRAG